MNWNLCLLPVFTCVYVRARAPLVCDTIIHKSLAYYDDRIRTFRLIITMTDEGEHSASEEEFEDGATTTKDDDVESTSNPQHTKSKKEERLKKLKELTLRRNEARKLNHQEVVEEDKRNKLPANWEARKRKVDWEIADEEARKKAELEGEDYEQVKLLETAAIDLERADRKKKKKNPDEGFKDFQQAQQRQYTRLVKQIEPDMEAYEKQKAEYGADFYPGVNSLGYGGSGKVSKDGVERMVADLEKQIDKRAKYSRRRQFNFEDNVDYINERNMKFNKKAARFYDKYTSETKQNLERGTAI